MIASNATSSPALRAWVDDCPGHPRPRIRTTSRCWWPKRPPWPRQPVGIGSSLPIRVVVRQGVTILNRNDGVGGDGWESNPPRTPHSLHSQPAYFSPERPLRLANVAPLEGQRKLFG